MTEVLREIPGTALGMTGLPRADLAIDFAED
jgi:hypothetical protein